MTTHDCDNHAVTGETDVSQSKAYPQEDHIDIRDDGGARGITAVLLHAWEIPQSLFNNLLQDTR